MGEQDEPLSDWDARVYRSHTGFVSELGAPVVRLLAPRPGERILDIGCGDGELTVSLVAAGCQVIGIDASEDMVAAAIRRGVDARLLDAARLESGHEYHGRFDAAFSNAALHWMRPMDAVARGMAAVLKPRGRLVVELGGEGNIAHIRDAIHHCLASRGIDASKIDPWVFPSPGEYTGILEAAGFEVTSMEHFERPTPLSTDIRHWVESVGRPFLRAITAAERPTFLAQVKDRLQPALCRDDGSWWADYVRLRVRALRRPVP